MHSDYDTNNSQYKTISILGPCYEGKGNVYLAKYLLTGQMLAVKRINLDKVKEDVDLIEHEIILTRQLQHPHIIKYLVDFVNGPEVHVVTPLMGYGSCRDLLNKHFHAGLPEQAIAIILRDVLEALEYAHKKGIIHRALRASHVLVAENGHSCLSGFRYSCPIIRHGKWQRQLHSFPSSTARNLSWLSPEVLEQNLQGYNEKSDIYSFGMLICELANGAEPFAGTATTLMLTEKVRGCVPQLLDRTTLPDEESESHGDSGLQQTYRKQASRKFSDGLHEMCILCLQREPYDRPTASQLLLHPLFKGSRRNSHLPDMLKPVIPFSDKVAYNTDELETFEAMQLMSELEMISCDWDF